MRTASGQQAQAAAFACDGGWRPRVLLLAYSISPVRGSEYSVGWNHVVEMSRHCDLTVLYGLAGPHMGDVEEIEDYLQAHGEMAHVHFVAIRPNRLARLLNAPNRAGVLVYSFYLAYRIWHAQAAREARRIAAAEKIDVIHYLCPIGYREPGYLWRLGKPYVWGPVGGLMPTRRLAGAPRPWASVAKTLLKNLINRAQLATAFRVGQALRRTDVVIAATSENRDALRRRFGVEAAHMAENAIPDAASTPASMAHGRSSDKNANLVWIGSLDYRKSPDLLLDALAQVAATSWRLHIVGDGPLMALSQRIANERGIGDRVIFHGFVPREEVQRLIAASDLHLITSMAEANTTVIWEAMGAGVPTLTLDHCGMHDVICDRCGLHIPVTDYASTRDKIAAEIDFLLSDRAKLRALAEGTVLCRADHLWSRRVKTWLDIYRQAISHHSERVAGKRPNLADTIAPGPSSSAESSPR